MNRRAILPAMSDASTVGLGSMVAEEGATTSPRTARAIRFFLLFEAATYVGAALAHFGIFVTGYEHRAAGTAESVIRSEEHTSELQSLTNLVCRLLLEKKKTHTKLTR